MAVGGAAPVSLGPGISGTPGIGSSAGGGVVVGGSVVGGSGSVVEGGSVEGGSVAGGVPEPGGVSTASSGADDTSPEHAERARRPDRARRALDFMTH